MRGTLLVALAVPAAAIVYDGVDYPWISNRSCRDDPDDCPGAGRCTQLPDYAGGNGSSGLFCRCGWFGQMKAPECQEPTSGTSNPFATYTTTAVVYGLVVLYSLFVACKAPSRTGLVSIVCVIVAACRFGASARTPMPAPARARQRRLQARRSKFYGTFRSGKSRRVCAGFLRR